MKGVVLAGGRGTRLLPLTHVTNKHLLPVYDRPMIHFPIECLLNAGIDDLQIVTGGEHAGDIVRLLGDGRHLGIDNLSFTHQEHERGIADALRLARAFAAGGPICVVLGDNIIEGNVLAAADEFRRHSHGAMVLLSEVADPRQFGVAGFEGERLAEIIEKPAHPPSSWAVIGIYFYDASVFDIIEGLQPSERGELEITDVNNEFIRRGQMTYERLEGWWSDAGTFENLHRAAGLVAAGGANRLDLAKRVRVARDPHSPWRM
jgi:glucose-1-phosphate thymidylyltransferase